MEWPCSERMHWDHEPEADWKVRPTRRLESLRYAGVHGVDAHWGHDHQLSTLNRLERRAMRLKLPHGSDDMIHVLAGGQEQVLGQRDRCGADLSVAFQFLETLAIRFEPRGAEEALETARSDRFVEQAVEILFVI